MYVKGKVSTFGGPNDTGVSSSEDLAFWEDWDDVTRDGVEHLFLPHQPPNTTGLARRLDPAAWYIACRWEYDELGGKSEVPQHAALVRAVKTGREFSASVADWGPNEDTGRVADISPGLMTALGITTDDEVEVTYPWTDAETEPVPEPEPEPRPEVTVALTIPHNVDLKLMINDIRFMTGDEHG